MMDSASPIKRPIVPLLVAALLAVLLGLFTRFSREPAAPMTSNALSPSPMELQGKPDLEAGDTRSVLANLPDVDAEVGAPARLPSPGNAGRASSVDAHSVGSVSAEGSAEVAGDLEDFVERAEAGEVDAAAELGGALYVCSQFFAELDRLQASLHPQIRRSEAETAAATARAEAALESDLFRARSRHCEGVPREMTASAGDWLEQAANGGDALAAELYLNYWLGRLDQLATDPPRLSHFRSNASSFMHRDAARCIPSAFLHLHNAYRMGTFETPDPALAIAFGAVFRWLAGHAEVEVSELAPSATPRQVLQGQAIAHRLYTGFCL